MQNIVISGTGVYTPPEYITNEELVASYNSYAEEYNRKNAAAIEKEELKAMQYSSSEFIEKASGIRQRYVMVKDGILDTKRMMPIIPRR